MNWCEVAGLIEYEEGQDLPDGLKTDRLILVAVLTEIRTLMQDCADVNGQYVELRPDNVSSSKEALEETDIIEEFSSISLSYERKSGERRYPRGLNYILRSAAMAKDVARYPKRLKWVVFDKDVFSRLLSRLTELNDFLHKLLHGHQAQVLERATQRTYLEIVQVRTSVDELKNLVAAAALSQSIRADDSPATAFRRKIDMSLVSLASFKSINVANEMPSSQKPASYYAVTDSTKVSYSQIIITPPEKGASGGPPNDRPRSDGVFYPRNGLECPVWIEWKAYRTNYDHHQSRHFPIPAHVKRVKELAALLCADKPNEFRTPRCLSYFDYRDDSDKSEHEARFSLLFEKPANSGIPVSLHYLITNRPKPGLSERIGLAYKITTSILFLHAVKWLHKGLRSDSVMFMVGAKGNLDISQPYITGYDYARPDKDGETTTSGEINEWWELYVHPYYQGLGRKGGYRKTFDIYSLGIILLEIAKWMCIEDLVGIDPDAATIDDLKGIRQELLRPESGHLDSVKLMSATDTIRL